MISYHCLLCDFKATYDDHEIAPDYCPVCGEISYQRIPNDCESKEKETQNPEE